MEEIPEDMQELAEKYRSELIEAIAENDEELMMKYLDGEELTIPEMKVAIRKETQSPIRSFRSCAALPIKTRACRSCSTPSWTTCRLRPTSRTSRA